MTDSSSLSVGEARIFSPYRALGLVCNEIPVVVRYLPGAKMTKIYSAVGNYVHTYTAHNLGLVVVSAPLPSDIRSLACDQRHVYVGFGKKVVALHQERNVKRIFAEHEADVKFILPFGDHLIVVDDNSAMKIWEIDNGDVYGEWRFGGPAFTVSAICHPATYLNKVIMGSQQGPLKLVNVKTGKLIFDFDGWGAGVSCLQQSTAVDVIGIGLQDGRIFLHNIKFNETIISFRQDWGVVTTITFRTDGPALMLTGSSAGHVAVWDLDKRKLFNQILDAHKSCGTTGVSALIALQNEPVVVSSGADNALRTWSFDMSDGGARRLRSQEGHGKSPTFVRFHGGERAKYVISAGGDSDVKMFHTANNKMHLNLGEAGPMRRAKAKKHKLDWDELRFPPITFLASDWARESGWDNIVCCHKDRPVVTTWTTRKQRLGSHKLHHRRYTMIPEFRNAVAVCCTVSVCGNFTLIGYSSGHVDVFNIQSGIYRGSYIDETNERAHTASVNGVCTDALNEFTFTACADGKLKFWHFSTKKLMHCMNLTTGVTRTVLHRDNGLLAVGLSNDSFLVIDVECKRVVRLFENAHKGRITDLAFNPSGHWVITASLDGRVKIWDLPSSSLVDVIIFTSPCTGLTTSPNGEYLATVHEEKLGVYLWINKTLFSPFFTLKPLPFDYEPIEHTALPSSETAAAAVSSDGDNGEERMDDGESAASKTGQDDAISGFVTFSGLPSPRWACLLDMDVIKERNKPKEPLKKPEKAPFFLPTIPNVSLTFDTDSAAGSGKETHVQSRSQILAGTEIRTRSEFGKALETLPAPCGERDCEKTLDLLKRLSPAGVEIELRNLSPINGGNIEMMRNFLRVIATQLGTKREFEICNAYLSLFVKLNRDVLWSEQSLREDLERARSAQKECWTRLDNLLNDTLSLVQYLKSSVL